MDERREPIYRIAQRAGDARRSGELRVWALRGLMTLGAFALLAFFYTPRFW